MDGISAAWLRQARQQLAQLISGDKRFRSKDVFSDKTRQGLQGRRAGGSGAIADGTSSMTNVWQSLSLATPLFARSSTRPGVATTMCTCVPRAPSPTDLDTPRQQRMLLHSQFSSATQPVLRKT